MEAIEGRRNWLRRETKGNPIVTKPDLDPEAVLDRDVKIALKKLGYRSPTVAELIISRPIARFFVKLGFR